MKPKWSFFLFSLYVIFIIRHIGGPIQFVVIIHIFDDIYVKTILVLLGQHLMLSLNLNPEENHNQYREDSGNRAKPLKSCHKTFQLMVTLDYKHFISRHAHGARCVAGFKIPVCKHILYAVIMVKSLHLYSDIIWLLLLERILGNMIYFNTVTPHYIKISNLCF